MSCALKAAVTCDAPWCEESAEATVALTFDDRDLPKLEVELPEGWSHTSGFYDRERGHHCPKHTKSRP